MRHTAHTISLVIPTCDRPHLLAHALASVMNQTVKPFETIVVNDSRDKHAETATVINAYQRHLPIITQNTIRHGIASSKYLGATAARGDIIVFLDDDLVAPPDYISRFQKHFAASPSLTAVFGRIQNVLTDNVYAATQFAYYDRGLRQVFPNFKKAQLLTHGHVLDCEAMGIRRQDFLTFYSPDQGTHYCNDGTVSCNDDVELGLRLLTAHKTVLFDPGIAALAYPRTTLFALLRVSFWNGYSDAVTEDRCRVKLRSAPHPSPRLMWLCKEAFSKKLYSPTKRLWYLIILLAFPFTAKIGRWRHYLTKNFYETRHRP